MLRVDALTKIYGPGAKATARKLAKNQEPDKEDLKARGTVIALRPMSFQIQPGEALAVMGPAQSGKTTLLRLIAGAETPSLGGVWLNERKLSQLGEGQRRVARRKKVRIVSNQDRLFPHLTLKENLMLAAKISAPKHAAKRVGALLKKLHLDAFADRFPAELTASNQRVAMLAQALTGEPQVLLLDGILDGLPASDRDELFDLLKNLRHELSLVMVVATEDAGIAFAVGDQLSILGAGEVLQTGSTLDVILEPGSEEVSKQLESFELGDVLTVSTLMRAAPTIRLGTPVTDTAVDAIVDSGDRYAAVLDEDLSFKGLVSAVSLKAAMSEGGDLSQHIIKPQTLPQDAKVRQARKTLLAQDHAIAVLTPEGLYQGIIDRCDVAKLP